MKKIFKKNQIIITALAIMIAAAGYVSYSDSKLKDADTETVSANDNAGTATDMDTVLQDIESLDLDLTDETSADTSTDLSGDSTTETPGEAVLTGASTYMAQARISREQIRSQNKETLLEIINNSELSETERQSAIASMVSMTDLIEKEAAAELLLEAKGFEDVVVNLTGETADIVVPQSQVDDASRAQIEDIVKRKTGIAAENIVITPASGSDETAATDTAADASAEETTDTAADAGVEDAAADTTAETAGTDGVVTE